MTRILQSCFVGTSMSRLKSVMCTTRAFGRTGYSFLNLKKLPCNTSKIGVSPTRFACTQRKVAITPGGTIAREDFAATLACESIMGGGRRLWLLEAKRPG